MQEKFNPLTGIRAVAAIMVFLYHNRKYWRNHLSGWLMQNLNEFHVGVPLFFVLSGFLIAYTYQDKPLGSKRSYLQYVLIRLFRIFPVYILLISVSYIDFGFPETNKIIFNYTLLKGFSDVYNLDALPQSWTLTVELCFYFLAPFIYWQTKKSIPLTIFYSLGLITERALLSRTLSTRLAILLGNASYAFYLVHFGYINRRLISFHLFPDRNFIVLWILAILIYLVIEKPVYEWARKMIKKLF